jgi:hypothetical protein
MLPSTVQELAILLLTALPGLVYLAVRERLLGPRPPEQELGSRILRAVAVSVVLDSLYMMALGPQLARLLSNKAGAFADVVRQPRVAGLAALALIVAVPAAVAVGEAAVLRRRRKARHDETPTAWDALFLRRGSCFIRVRLKSGIWVGGWYGRGSNASAYPQPADLYLESQRRMNPDGTFGQKVPGTGGVYIRASDVEVLEVLEPVQPGEGAPDGRPNQA